MAELVGRGRMDDCQTFNSYRVVAALGSGEHDAPGFAYRGLGVINLAARAIVLTAF
jgi:hypothetical protein